MAGTRFTAERGRGAMRGYVGVRGRARGAAPARGADRALSPEPVDARVEGEAPSRRDAAPETHSILLRVLEVVERLADGFIPRGFQTDTQPGMSDRRQVKYARFCELSPPQFHGGLGENPYEFLLACHGLLRRLEVAPAHRVDFTVLQLHGPARRWWKFFVGPISHDSSLVTWETFARAFLDQYGSCRVREDLRRRFECLVQGDMTVDEYAVHFYELFAYALSVFLTVEDRITRFVRGLTPSIQRQLLVFSGAEGATLQGVIDLAKGLELLHRDRIGDIGGEEPCVFSPSSDVLVRSEGPPRRRRYVHRSVSHQARLQGFPYQTAAHGSCCRCGQTGCSASSLQLEGPRRCFSCGKMGHFRRFCPSVPIGDDLGRASASTSGTLCHAFPERPETGGLEVAPTGMFCNLIDLTMF